VAAALTLAAHSANAQTPDTAAAIAELQKQIQSLQSEVNRLKEGAASTAAAQDSLIGQDLLKAKGLSFAFYGESKYRLPQSGADTFDAHRYVLTPSYQISDWLIFNSEFELEHGGVDESTGRGSRFTGELELEQFYVDILVNEYFNVRSLGIDLVPVGRVNTIHEPTTFYSTERPELYREIIPTTWMEPSMGFFGKITDTLDWRAMISTGLEDFSSSSPGNPGVTAVNGMRNARPRMRAADESKLAYTGRLNFSGIKGLDTSTSVYHAGAEGFNQQDVSMTLWDIEALYRVPGTGLELRGDFAYWWIGNSENLIANNNASTTDNVGDAMYGWYVEAAYHLWPNAWREGKGEKMDLVPFIRFSQIVTQTGLASGTTIDNGTANRDFITAGVSWFLNEHFVVKGDWRHNLDESTVSEASAASQDYFQLGVGMFF
jgi:hypothetical protein